MHLLCEARARLRVLGRDGRRGRGAPVMWSVPVLLSQLSVRLVAAQQVIISEIMYHPPDPTGPEIALGIADAKQFEYIKLTAGNGPVQLAAGTELTDGVSFTFDQPWSLEAGSFLVIADDQSAFEARYGFPDPSKFVCCFAGKLSNRGETVVLSDARGSELARAEYSDDAPQADGNGAALAWLDSGWQVVEPSPHCRWPTEWIRDEANAGATELLSATLVIINEINYKPANSVVNEWRDSDRGGQCRTDFVWKRGGDLDEYIELHNPTQEDIDLAGWQLAEGVSYTFPTGSESVVIPAGGYLLLCREDPDQTGDSVTDPELCCHQPAAGHAGRCCHRYSGKLANSGERVTLLDVQSRIVEQVRYRSEQPWPESPDGYGRSLERLSGAAPSGNPDSWAASAIIGGSPGLENSVGVQPAAGVYVRRSPVVVPSQPAPGSDTAIEVEIGGARTDMITSVRLLWSLVPPQGTPTSTATVIMIESDGRYSATFRPTGCAGNCMLRYKLSVTVGGAEFTFPSDHDPLPCWSAFVTTGTEPPPSAGGHRLIIFGYPLPQTSELHHSLSGVVLWSPGEAEAQVFDGSTVHLTKKNNLEIDFVKSNRWQGRDQLKVAFEAGVRGQGGELGPIVEHWGYWLFSNQPSSEVVVPLNSFMRVEINSVEQQALVLGLYDSTRMQEEGRGEHGDVWKRGFYHGYFTYKVTNVDERVLDLQKMIERLRTVTAGGPLSELVDIAGIRVQAWLSFLSGCLLISNWDGYMNNHFLHQDVHGDGLWDILPWDFDKTSGLQNPSSYARAQNTNMPPQFGLDGHARANARPPNPDGIASINKALLHHCEFAAAFRDFMEITSVWLGGDEVAAALDAHEAAMLAQLAVMEEASGGTPRSARRTAIANAHAGLRSYNRLRSAFLTSNEGVQCTLQWCDGSSHGTSTLLSMVASTSTITRQGSGPDCVWTPAAPRPRRTSLGNTDCARVGGLEAVGSGAQACSCCTTEGGSTTGETTPFVQRHRPSLTTCATEAIWSTGGDDSDPDGSDAVLSIAGCAEDVDQDGRVNVSDLLLVLSAFGMRDCCISEVCDIADVNDDCMVSVADILLVLAAYGMEC